MTSSCGGIKTLNRVDVAIDETSNTRSSDKVASENRQEVKIIKDDTVKIGEKSGEVFEGASLDSSDRQNLRKLKVGLSLGPGLHRAIAYIELLKELEKNNIKLEVITGTEMGAVVAALYAAGTTPEAIEWMFFKYFREENREKYYEKSWISLIDKHFLMKIKNKEIKETRIKFYITLFDHNTKKTYFFDNGNLRQLVLLNLRLNNNPLKFSNGVKYSGSMEKEIFNSRLLNKIGAEFTVSADAVGKNIEFNEANDFLTGVFGKISGLRESSKKAFNHNISFNSNGMTLDGLDVSSFVSDSKEYSTLQIGVLKKKMNAKLDEYREIERAKEIE